MLGGMGIIPVVSAGPWVITVGEDEDGDYVIQAVSEDPETTGDGIDALEHRFLLGLPCEDDEGGVEFDDETELVAVHWGVQVHTCKSRSEDDDADECEIFRPSKGQVEEDDLPESVVEVVEDLFSDEVYLPTPDDMFETDDGEGRELRGLTLVSEADEEQLSELGDAEPDTNPEGMFY